MPSDELAEAKAMLEKVTKAWHERLDQVQDLKEMVRDAQVAKADAMAHAEQCQASMAAALDKAMGEMRSRVAAEKRAAEAESARDAWAHQCNLASEAYAALLARPASVDAAVGEAGDAMAHAGQVMRSQWVPMAESDPGILEAWRTARSQWLTLRSRPQPAATEPKGGGK